MLIKNKLLNIVKENVTVNNHKIYAKVISLNIYFIVPFLSNEVISIL